MISARPDDLRRRAEGWASAAGESATVVEALSTIGGGSLPGETLPTFALSIDPGEAGADAIARRLRTAHTPVIGRIESGRVLLDPRTVLPHQDGELIAALGSASVR